MKPSVFAALSIFASLFAGAEDFPNQARGTKQSPLTLEKADYQGWELVWNDEFDSGGNPDPAKWNDEHGFVRNRELQWYQRANARCESGLLIIEGKKETVANPAYDKDSDSWQKNRPEAHYTSASLTTKGKSAWLYGRFEIRARFAPQEGLWPAFWTVGVTERWPSCGEIDIMEYYKNTFLANLCWASDKPFVGFWSTTKTPLATFTGKDPQWGSKFHVYRMDWDENTISLYVDDILLNRTDISSIENLRYDKVKNPFRQPQAIIINLALGATGGSLEQVQWPQRYEIDYVRVYQRTDSPHKGTIPVGNRR